MFSPEAIIASFINEERTRAFQLQANGVLTQIDRPTPSDVWSPPKEAAALAGSMESFEAYLRESTVAAPPGRGGSGEAEPPVQTLTQVEFDAADFELAERVARRLGFEQFAYTSTSALWGLFCLPENPVHAKPGQATKGGCIIKTRELGLMFVQDGEDLHLGFGFCDA